MANPMIPQGSLNLLRAALQVTNLPSLNVTASYLSEGMITLTQEGDASLLIPTATGAVPSPNPYVIVNVLIHLVRSQTLAASWKLQMETTTDLGPIVVIGDASALAMWHFYQATLMNVGELTFNGKDAGYPINIRAVYPVNSAMYNTQ